MLSGSLNDARFTLYIEVGIATEGTFLSRVGYMF